VDSAEKTEHKPLVPYRVRILPRLRFFRISEGVRQPIRNGSQVEIKAHHICVPRAQPPLIEVPEFTGAALIN
jgi:hypothetical protein